MKVQTVSRQEGIAGLDQEALDDEVYIVKNPHIRSLWPLGECLTHSTRPAVNFSFAVNYALGGLNPCGYHLVNVGIHLLVALLLYGEPFPAWVGGGYPRMARSGGIRPPG